MPGTYPTNRHQENRAEVLADHLFSSWGTVTPVRRSDDHGAERLSSSTGCSAFGSKRMRTPACFVVWGYCGFGCLIGIASTSCHQAQLCSKA